jgi:hypothetical protein
MQMENRNTILTELKEISPVVAQMGFQCPYEVPQGYFEGFADTVLQRIKASEAASAREELETLSPLLSRLSKKMPFSTPPGYFDELSDNAVAGASAIEFVNVELENLSPLMSSLKNKAVYEVPAGYFENLPEQMLKQAKSQPAKVVRMNFARRAMRYAAAAVVAGLIIAAAWIYLGTNKSADGTSIAGIEQVSDEMLENYLETNLVEAPVLASNSSEIDADDLKDILADVTDEELQKYVDQYGLKDIATN